MNRDPIKERGPVLSEIQNTSIFSFDDVDDEELGSLVTDSITNFDEGDLVKGTIVQIERDEVLVDIGYKSEGVIPVRELSIRKDADPSTLVDVGDEVEALVIQQEDQEGRLVLSKKRAEYEKAWNRVEEHYNNQDVVEGEVIEVVKGGLILDIGLRGFLPASLVDLRRVKDLQDFLGTIIETRIIEMDRNRNNVVLSRRVVLEEERRSEREAILSQIQPGMRLRGVVSSVVDFGVFVDLGGIDGLIHISELSWGHINHPSEVVKNGDEIEVEVLEVDMKRQRISLGLKQTTEDPWVVTANENPVGTIMEGTVSKLVSFGAFVDLGNGVEGLIHISELAPEHVEKASQVVNVGDLVQVKVTEIDEERHRISLSHRAAAEALGFEVEVTPLEEPEEASEKSKDSKKAKDAEKSAKDVDKAAEAASKDDAKAQEEEAKEPQKEAKEAEKKPATKKKAAKKEEAETADATDDASEEAPAQDKKEESDTQEDASKE